MIHSHWIIWGYSKERKNQAGDTVFDDIVKISVTADSEIEAIKKATETIKRKGYRVSEVSRCEIDHEIKDDLHDDMIMLQLEMQKKLLKKLT